MLRIATLIFAIVGTTLAGIGIMIVVSVPSLADQSMRLIPIVSLVGFALGMPVSYLVARAIGNQGVQHP
jgi:hypothetical protein